MKPDGTRVKARLAGAGVLASLALTRLAASADEAAVSFAGRGLPWLCPLRSLFGLPCPTCGMTRSVVLSLHGEWGRAAALNPAGPLLVFGLLALGLLLLLAACSPRASRRRASTGAALPRAALIGVYAYGCLTGVVLLVHWVRALG